MKPKTLFFSSLIAAAAMSSVPAWAETKTQSGGTGTITEDATYDLIEVKNGGTLNQSSGTVSTTKFQLHNAANSNTDTYNLSGGVLNVTSTMTTESTDVALGHWPSGTGILNVSGTGVLNVTSGLLNVSRDGNGTLSISGGEVNAYGITLSPSKSTGNWAGNALLQMTAGRLNIGAGGIIGADASYSGTKTKVINLNGGALGALDSWSSSATMTLGGDVAIDTTKWVSSGSGTGASATGDNTGATITLSGNITQTAGTLTVSGAGTLDLSGATVALTSAISNSATVKVNTSTVFVLADALKNSSSTDSDSSTSYTLITNNNGGKITDWSTLTISNFRQADGSSFSGRSVANVDTAGAVTITGVAFNLFWNGGTSGTWNTTETIWGKDSAGGTATAFATGDNVTFGTSGDVAVAVDSSGVTARTMTVSAGTVTLSGGNVTANAANITAGTLVLSSGTKLTTADGITVRGTGTLKISSKTNIGGSVTVGTGGTFDLNGASGDVMLNTGFSTLTLAGGKLTNTGASVGTTSQQLYSLTVSSDSEIGGTGNFGLIGSNYGATTLNLGANTLTKTGDNTLWLINTTVNGTGTIKVSGGSIADNKSDSSMALGNASIVLDGGSANFSGTVIAGASTLNGGSVEGKQMSIGTLKFGYGSGAQTLNISGKVSVSGNFQEVATSSGSENGETIKLSDGANFSVGGTFGTTNANANDSGQHSYTLNVGSGASFSAGTIAHGDALTVNIGGGNASVSATTLVLNGVWGNKTHSFTGQGADVSTLSVGTVNLNNNTTKSYTTTLSVSNARFEVGAGGITGSSSTPVSLNGVTLGVRDGADSWSSSLAMTLAGAMGADVASGKSITLDGVLSGTTTGFTKTGDGTLTLGGANTFSTTNLTVSAGTLNISGASTTKVTGTFSGAGTLNVNDGGVLELVGANGSSGNETNQTAGTINVKGGGTLNFSGHDLMGWDNNPGSAANVAAILAGASEEKVARLNINDSASLTLSRNVTMSGNALISTTSSSSFASYGGKITATGTNNTISTVGVKVRNNFEIAVTNDADVLEIASPISGFANNNGQLGTGGITKTGTGTLILSGDNSGLSTGAGSVTRTITVSAGTVVAKTASALGSTATTVNDGGVLKVSVNGGVNVGAGSVTFNENAKFAIDLTAYTDVKADKALSIITASAISFNNGNTNTVALTSDDIESYFSEADSDLGTWTDYVRTWSNDNGTLTLTLTTIPEPSTFGLLAGAGALALVAARRRRRAK